MKKTCNAVLGDVDTTGRLKPSALFRLLQDAASAHAEDLGLGFYRLSSRFGLTWVLVRIRVDISRMPTLHEELTVETWPRPPRSLQFDREFLVRDKQGGVAVRAASVWSLMDLVNRRIRRSGEVAGLFPPVDDRLALTQRPGKCKPAAPPREVYRRRIGYSDLDLNEHLNNARYVDFVMDCFSLEEHREFRLSSIEMAFLREALPGQTLILRRDLWQTADKTVYIDGLLEENGQVVFQAVVDIHRAQDGDLLAGEKQTKSLG